MSVPKIRFGFTENNFRMTIEEGQTACPALGKSNSNNILSKIVNAAIVMQKIKSKQLFQFSTITWPTVYPCSILISEGTCTIPSAL